MATSTEAFSLLELPGIQGVKIIPDEKFSKKEFIAKGGFGGVYRAKLGNVDVAVKQSFDPLVIEAEVQMLNRVSAECHHIVGFYGITVDKANTGGIVLEYCANGTLRNYLQEEFSRLQWKE